MNRYLNSFFIALTCYVLFGIAIFYILSNNEIIKIQEENKTISLNHIELKPEVQTEQKELPKEEILPKEEKKEIKKVVEKPIEKPKPIIEKKVENKVVKEKALEKKEIVESTKQTVEDTQKQVTTTTSEIQTQTLSKPVVDEKKEYLDKYLSQIRDLINQNVKYPPKAKKLSIEGIVIVKFKITQNGDVEDITIIDGHKFLQDATISAIEEASKNFPKTNKSIEIQIPIEYKLI
jgi:TonB family protein